MTTKKQLLIAVSFISAIAITSSANLAGAAAEWTPLVRIPGLPTTGTVNLSMYLIGLYNFLLSIVGIVAVVMLIIGGMRYITAVGNPTAISDAKDIIISAITGLILALLSWVFISAINPDVLYIKQPGSGIIDPSLAVKDLATVPVTTTPTPCIKPGSPVDENTPGFKYFPYFSNCQCIDFAFVAPAAGVSCQDTCKTGNCFIADFRVGKMNTDANNLTDKERAQKYAINAANSVAEAQDYTFGTALSCYLAINAADYTTSFADVTTMVMSIGAEASPDFFDPDCANASNLDLLAEPNPGYFGPQVVAANCPIGAINSIYADWETDTTNCKKIKDPESVVCPIKLCVEWNGGAIKREKVMYVKMDNEY